ncbi:prepilin-type N-terminal cleavage/methylation domain-containing protein [Clostridium estertheticum]|uniref:prepilin-type N-terminal cleavage/methylation domain-containing protein n=1 Tax=Clostridium estertheticum TaxID=238834 RepID=UPI0013E98D7F|nr:prepilin-type N-terminal cleavage/methylation domain-containing protein [Clostridium estertheticum]
MKKNVKKKKGFTLIELMIVISIIVVIAAIAVPKYGNIQKDAKIKADIASAKVIADATVALMAQEKITKTNYSAGVEITDTNVAESATVIKDYLQTVPVVKAIKDAKFIVKIDTNENVTVLANTAAIGVSGENDYVAAGNYTLYPTPTTLGYPTNPDK